jgi:thiol-disulfide isomerase/thioredoxin
MQRTTIFALLAVVFAGLVSAQIPIPNRPDGYGVGGPADAHVAIDMFLDLLCPDCKATWPIVLQVIQAYGVKIHFRIHTFPLPYHTNAFVVAQGLHAVANITDRNLDAIYKYTTEIFNHQQMWYNDATKTMTIPQVVDSLATFSAQTGLVTKDQFVTAMGFDDINFETRVSWKYACSRGNYFEKKKQIDQLYFDNF